MKVLDHFKDNDSTLTLNVVWALGEIASPSTSGSLVPLLSSPDESLRLQTVWALSKFKGADIAAKIAEVMEKDSSEKVRAAAKLALEWQKRIE